MIKIAEKIMEKTSKLLTSEEFKNRHKTIDKSFSRNRALGFTNIMGICLNSAKKSLQIELDSYFNLFDSQKTVTKQAFSKQRKFISPTAFVELFEMTVEYAMKNKAIKQFKGHRFFAIDGTELQIPKTEETTRKFTQNRGSTSPRARVSTLCDVLSGFIIHAEIEATTVDERTLAKRHLSYFMKYKKSKDVVLFDRGYPSKNMVDFLHKNKIKYIIRFQKKHNKKIDESTERDFFVVIDGHRFRVIKLMLESGEEEVLITNLGKNAFLYHEFQELYHLRWAIETKYNT